VTPVTFKTDHQPQVRQSRRGRACNLLSADEHAAQSHDLRVIPLARRRGDRV